MYPHPLARALQLLSFAVAVQGALIANQTDSYLLIANDRLTAAVNKSSGAISHLYLDGQNLLGRLISTVVTPGGTTGNGDSGVGPYLDCHCTPEGAYTPGSQNATYTLYQGVDSLNVSYGGISMSQVYAPTGQVLEQYWFLRDGETGLHAFSRFAYHNKTTPTSGVFQEFRTLFRPDTPLWTDLITNSEIYAPLPVPDPAAWNLTDAYTVQDATWYIGNRTDDPYVEAFSDYFTKYTFSTAYRDQKVHGMFADGTHSNDGSAFGSWLVMNTKDTYFGGPTWSDLVVDGIVYNYIVSNHHGNQAPNITDGFDRTFGPSYFHFNRGEPGTTWQELRDDALAFASPEWNAQFYDDIAHLVPNYVPTSARGSWKAKISIPAGGEDPVAVLSVPGFDFQDNSHDTNAYQYWADADPRTGAVQIDRVKAGTYRLTVYASGVFGDYVQEGVVVSPGETTDSGRVTWTPESAGKELWRVGTPDKAGGEWLHGDHPDPNHPLHPPEYRIYFGVYDYLDDFPDGVDFHVGQSDEAKDFNYIHWSVFGGYANSVRPVQVEGDGNINNWTITFDTEEEDLTGTQEATFTIQLAAAKGASGNTDVYNASQVYNDIPYNVVVNGHALETWTIPYYQSSSCGVRSGIACYYLANKWTFPTSYLQAGKNATNKIILSLPYNATDYESAVLPGSIYVQYDALRLEVK
ncbi:Rhamnogalacturonate lyase B [Cytospora mali]|uniref:Rhamnogalacturonate lyase B n=1 Tax=Cytospora mali TaxID=578113 RepID=A0A194W6G1_CYTMA|nr:Rhamnogalacturonate lyase B [Valsa mali]